MSNLLLERESDVGGFAKLVLGFTLMQQQCLGKNKWPRRKRSLGLILPLGAGALG